MERGVGGKSKAAFVGSRRIKAFRFVGGVALASVAWVATFLSSTATRGKLTATESKFQRSEMPYRLSQLDKLMP